MLAFAFVLLGTALGVWVPRHRQGALYAVATVVGVCGGLACAVGFSLSIALGAVATCAAVFVALLLARGLPRLFLFLSIAVAFLVAVPSPPVEAPPLRLALGVLALLAALLLTAKAEPGFRVACALAGAKLVLAAAPHHPAPWGAIELAVAAVCLWAAATATAPALQRSRVARRPLSQVAGRALLAGGLAGLALLAALPLARELPAAAAPFAGRQARLREVSPHGGLLWPLPSEAIFWDDDTRGEFPHFPNLDALYLGGAPHGLWRLPHTTLGGSLALTRAVVDLRAVKDQAELAAMRAAAQASVRAVHEALPLVRAGTREADLGEAVRAAHLRAGCSGESFPPVVAAGPSAAAPHGSGSQGVLQDAQLVVTDVGCLYRGYASDFTRTLPVGGRFSERQRKLYDAVYAAQQAAVAACKPGVEAAGRKNPRSLDAIARAALKARGYDDNNPFGIGHSVGLFVHDPLPPQPLREGMVITIEPGLYVKGELGIRIEDTYLVTRTGCEPLTSGFPADAASVEAALQAAVTARR